MSLLCQTDERHVICLLSLPQCQCVKLSFFIYGSRILIESNASLLPLICWIPATRVPMWRISFESYRKKGVNCFRLHVFLCMSSFSECCVLTNFRFGGRSTNFELKGKFAHENLNLQIKRDFSTIKWSILQWSGISWSMEAYQVWFKFFSNSIYVPVRVSSQFQISFKLSFNWKLLFYLWSRNF